MAVAIITSRINHIHMLKNKIYYRQKKSEHKQLLGKEITMEEIKTIMQNLYNNGPSRNSLFSNSGRLASMFKGVLQNISSLSQDCPAEITETNFWFADTTSRGQGSLWH